MKKKCMAFIVLACLLLTATSCGRKDENSTIGSLDGSMSSEDIIAAESTKTQEQENNMESSEATETDELETVYIPETTREPSEILPDVAIYDSTVLENYVLDINNAERYTINYPEGYSVTQVDKYKTFLVQDNTQIFLYCINDEFDSSQHVFFSTQIDDELYRFPYVIDGKNYTASVMDRGTASHLEINGKDVVRETPKIEFASDDIKSFVRPTCVSYFTSFNERGFALIAVSTDKEIGELDNVLTDMFSTLGTYIPSKAEAKYEFDGRLFVANDKTGISFPYPEGWELATRENGFVVISAPSDGSLYDGAKIIYKSDEKHEFVEDYAQYAGIVEEIAPFYMTGSYDKESLGTEFLVMSMDDTVTVDGIKCYLFEIEDSLLPFNKTTELLLPSTGEKIYSYRYTFNSNGIPVMVSFHYTKNNKYQVRDMADNIMKKITVK